VDVAKLHEDLPAFVKNQIPDPGTVFWDNMSTFLTNHYNPTIAALQGEVNRWEADLLTSQAVVENLVDQLRKPGDLIAKIDQLPEHERADQDIILADFSNRRLSRLVDSLTPNFTLSREKLAVNARIPIPPPTVAPALSYEPQSGSVPGIGPSAQRGSWFVGDY